MDTPRSESPSFPAASPLAVPELDDHRFQPHSLPRSSMVPSPSRLRPDLEVTRPRSKDCSDNDFAIYDDDDMLSPTLRVDHAAGLERKGSIARSARSVRFPSNVSSRSPSPPNSVDAFADPEHRRMRERSNTVTSEMPDDLRLCLQRTNSRRPTFVGDDGIRGSDTDVTKPEEDVCFPPPEEPRIRGAAIDFEEMDEFVAMQARGRPAQPQRRKSIAGSFKGRYQNGLAPDSSATEVEEAAVDDASSIIDEKVPSPKPARAARLLDRFSFFSSEMDATVHAPEIGELLLDGESFQDLFRGGQGVWWLDCLNPSHEELGMLMKAFGIHPLTAEDIRVQETREKVELFKSYYFVCFRSFVQAKEHEEYMEPINIYIIVFREGVLSFHFAPSNHSANVRRRIRQLRDYVALSADWICYALIDDIVDSFAPLITDIEKDSDAIEDAVFQARDEDYAELLKRIGECRKRTMGGMRLLGGKADVIKGFAKRCNEQYHITPRGEIGLYLGDIQGSYSYPTTTVAVHTNSGGFDRPYHHDDGKPESL
jgi:magnesium transporter